MFRENRYLLFITENYAALHLLEHYISGNNQNTTIVTELSGTSNSVNPEDLRPYILFGSSFPKDKEYTQVSV